MLCLGSLNIDHVYSMDHFVQAGETVASLGLTDHCGGKGLNQALALRRAGCPVFMAGMIGRDGHPLLELLRQNGVDTTHVRVEEEQPTGHAVIQVDKTGQNCIVIYGGANQCIDPTFIDSVYSHFAPGDVVLLQNEISHLPYAMRRAGQLGLRVALNPSPMTEELATCPELEAVSWFILNELEGQAITGETEGKKICLAMRKKFPHAEIMLTLGKAGCLYYDGQTFAGHGIYDVPVVDTTAAGDTFTGYFLAGISEGLPIAGILELASKASSLAVSVAGAANSIPERAAVEQVRLKAT